MAKKVVKDFVWCICRINKDYTHNLDYDLGRDDKYEDIEAYIPTVKVLKKTFKGKEQFDNVPLLFNYGFFKIPRIYAIRPYFLRKLREDVKCIYSWVRDAASVLSEHPVLSADNVETRNKNYEYSVATASDAEISYLMASAASNSVYSQEDIERLEEGQQITLHGYPFDNVPATVIKINHSKKEVKVKLELFQVMKEVSVSFDNVFYTVYKSKFNEEPLKEISLEQMQENIDAHSMDSLFTKAKYFQEPKLPE